jgi:hypothetical protein
MGPRRHTEYWRTCRKMPTSGAIGTTVIFLCLVLPIFRQEKLNQA